MDLKQAVQRPDASRSTPSERCASNHRNGDRFGLIRRRIIVHLTMLGRRDQPRDPVQGGVENAGRVG
ncbi:hypothetical protein [Lichenicoccus roseus]|uniref:Uncharacterized protein n=1 Tax=Lichenicoccus roseus TaxID=2683649 RepID=A0A5R9J8P5_9PROT|nr:hypothetical protein [Lichenicoccus roseus]TLU70588.1 hypothetical protein FE263_21115 [Lichenicoccus roseus]